MLFATKMGDEFAKTQSPPPNIFLCRIWSTEAPKDSVTASLRYTRGERETLKQKV